VWDDGRNNWSESWSKSSWKDGKSAPGESEVTRGSFDPKGTGTQTNNLPKFGEAPRLNKAPKGEVPPDLVKPPKPSDDIWKLPTEIYKDLESKKVINGDGYLSVNNPTTYRRFREKQQLAWDILKDAYDDYAKTIILYGGLEVTDSKGILDAMDRANNWLSGTAKKKYGDLYGMAHHGRIYINTNLNKDDTTILKTMVHEMLHINQHRDLTNSVGRNLMEGLTQHLAMQAFRASGRPWDDAGGYKAQAKVVLGLERLLGRETLIDAYFNNPRRLVTEFNQVAGRDLFGTFQQLLNESKFDDAVHLIWSLED
jgi:hypothetical protein